MDYHDPRYHFFNGVHTGIDLIPSDTYYRTNRAYLLTHQQIVFATMNGTAISYLDPYGAIIVDIYNAKHTIITRYVHLQASFFSTGEIVKAGQALGIMGATGFVTGIHLHYEIQTNQSGMFQTVDPKLLIE
ncbi:MAG TPA: M23 family metallopeptidase [Patescibacteria group bacterium]|nr:M23 family metallopeptidase [Patescibacteria group bacterium]